MKISRFEDILAWQEVRELSGKVYQHFSNSKDFSFRDQICRAAISVSNNIAEGFERQSNKELKQFFCLLPKDQVQRFVQCCMLPRI